MSRQWNTVSDRHRKSGKNVQRIEMRHTYTASVANGRHRALLADDDAIKSGRDDYYDDYYGDHRGNGRMSGTTLSGHQEYDGRRTSGLIGATLSLKSLSLSAPAPTLVPDVDYVGEMQQAMRRWGVMPNRRDVHGDFWHRHMRWIRLVVANDADTLPYLPQHDLQVLSADPLRAMEEVFEQEMSAMLCNIRGFPVEADKCARANREIVPTDAPYEYSRRTRRWELRDKFAGCDPDPFRRFAFRRIPARAQVQHTFVELDAVGPDMRAIVAYGACHRASCVQCKQVRCIRWNRLSSNARSRHWRRLVCANCRSVYDIFSKPTEAAVFKCLDTTLFCGGNKFDYYVSVQQVLPLGAKQFVALVSRETAREGPMSGGQRNWLVYVAEVVSITPALKAKSFFLEDDDNGNDYDTHCTVYASVRVRQGWDMWFKVPYFEFDARAIASSILRGKERSERRRTLLR